MADNLGCLVKEEEDRIRAIKAYAEHYPDGAVGEDILYLIEKINRLIGDVETIGL